MKKLFALLLIICMMAVCTVACDTTTDTDIIEPAESVVVNESEPETDTESDTEQDPSVDIDASVDESDVVEESTEIDDVPDTVDEVVDAESETATE